MTRIPRLRVLALAVLVSLAASGAALAQSTTRVSVSSNGLQGDDVSTTAYVSDDGRYIVFMTNANDLVPGGNSGQLQVYVHDRQTGITELVSATPGGAPGNNQSSISNRVSVASAHMSKIVFGSFSNDLVPGDTNNSADVFVRDRLSGVTTRVSTDVNGQQGNGHTQSASISSDGSFVAFDSIAGNLLPNDTNGKWDVFVKNLVTGAVELASANSFNNFVNGDSFTPAISGDARWVAFMSDSSQLVQGDTNGVRDIFVRDRLNGATERVSVSTLGLAANDVSEYPAISANGIQVLFQSFATNLVASDTNGFSDVFLRDRALGTTRRLSVSSAGVQANAQSYPGSITPRGRYVAFWSAANNLLAGDTNGKPDVFRLDLKTQALLLLSVSSAGAQGNEFSDWPAMSASGSVIAFASMATNLIAGDANFIRDVFVRDLTSSAAPIVSYCTAKASSAGCIGSIGTSGIACVASSDAFRLCAGNLPEFSTGLFFWGKNPSATPFHGGTLCVAPPLARSPVSNTGVNLSNSSCTGATAFPITTAAFASHGFVAGDTGYAQFWLRDPGFPAPNNLALTDGVAFVIEP